MMPPQLHRAELTQRLRGQGNDLIVQVASLMQGGILSAAAFSLIEILRTQDDVLVRLIFCGKSWTFELPRLHAHRGACPLIRLETA